jgi:hypothetical protein
LLKGPPLSAATIALEISGPNARVAPLQRRWDCLRAGLDLILILDQPGADMADLPGGASGLLARGLRGKEADRLVTRIDPGAVSLVAELRGHEWQAAEELGVKDAPRGAQDRGQPQLRLRPSQNRTTACG